MGVVPASKAVLVGRAWFPQLCATLFAHKCAHYCSQPRFLATGFQGDDLTTGMLTGRFGIAPDVPAKAPNHRMVAAIFSERHLQCWKSRCAIYMTSTMAVRGT